MVVREISWFPLVSSLGKSRRTVKVSSGVRTQASRTANPGQDSSGVSSLDQVPAKLPQASSGDKNHLKQQVSLLSSNNGDRVLAA